MSTLSLVWVYPKEKPTDFDLSLVASIRKLGYDITMSPSTADAESVLESRFVHVLIAGYSAVDWLATVVPTFNVQRILWSDFVARTPGKAAEITAMYPTVDYLPNSTELLASLKGLKELLDPKAEPAPKSWFDVPEPDLLLDGKDLDVDFGAPSFALRALPYSDEKYINVKNRFVREWSGKSPIPKIKKVQFVTNSIVDKRLDDVRKMESRIRLWMALDVSALDRLQERGFSDTDKRTKSGYSGIFLSDSPSKAWSFAVARHGWKAVGKARLVLVDVAYRKQSTHKLSAYAGALGSDATADLVKVAEDSTNEYFVLLNPKQAAVRFILEF